ncbi:MAG: hypothetical protein BBJ57_13945 [Desulfobacterales bacterium PC51MH44]|nr:MAG: hypothetical protein BBJ57_13945 [Desulfobacterales bacterium PC51MH44]
MIESVVIFHVKAIKIKLVHGPKHLNQKSKISIKNFHLKPPLFFAFNDPKCRSLLIWCFYDTLQAISEK